VYYQNSYSPVRVISGQLVSQNRVPSVSEVEEVLQSDDILKTGLLFLGGARQGKTNVMTKVFFDIMQKRQLEDTVVFFDIKGDYRKLFYRADWPSDILLSPRSDACLLNLFEGLTDLVGVHDDLLSLRVSEITEYLFRGQTGGSDPFWVNSAKMVVRCIILYMVYEASMDPTYPLNHATFCSILDGRYFNNDYTALALYDQYREILLSYDRFRASATFFEPIDPDHPGQMGNSIIAEILTMRGEIFQGSFEKGKEWVGQRYISPNTLTQHNEGRVLFLEVDTEFDRCCKPLFSLFLDMLIASYVSQKDTERRGKLYLFLDEFAMLPPCRRLGEALNFGAGPGIRVIGGLQMVDQVRQMYPEPGAANTLLGGFQNLVVFHCDHESIKMTQDRLGGAFVQSVYRKAGGGIGYSEPRNVPSAEEHEFADLRVGEAIVRLQTAGDMGRPFRIHFPLYIKKKI
jgi:hypothetical protein